jgi:hypothetical protein
LTGTEKTVGIIADGFFFGFHVRTVWRSNIVKRFRPYLYPISPLFFLNGSAGHFGLVAAVAYQNTKAVWVARE